MTKIKSVFCYLDVTSGRRALEKDVKRKPVRVIIEAEIFDVGNDDGLSTEFECEVKSVARIQ